MEKITPYVEHPIPIKITTEKEAARRRRMLTGTPPPQKRPSYHAIFSLYISLSLSPSLPPSLSLSIFFSLSVSLSLSLSLSVSVFLYLCTPNPNTCTPHPQGLAPLVVPERTDRKGFLGLPELQAIRKAPLHHHVIGITSPSLGGPRKSLGFRV